MSGRHATVFVNERSYPIPSQDAVDVALRFLRVLRKVKEIVSDIAVVSNERLTDIPLTSDHRTLSSYAGAIGKDWWRFLAGLQQRSPFHQAEGCLRDAHTHFVCKDGDLDEAFAWTFENDSVAISFASSLHWLDAHVSGGYCNCDDHRHRTSAKAVVTHLALEEHVDAHRLVIEALGLEFRGGSLVWETADFCLRMPPRDHEPMHVHVCPPGTAAETWATVRFDRRPEILAGRLSPEVLASVKDLITEFRPQLVANWERRRLGLPAAFIYQR